jgi:hypothetical protein
MICEGLAGALPEQKVDQHGKGADERTAIETLIEHVPSSRRTIKASNRYILYRMVSAFVLVGSVHQHNIRIAVRNVVQPDAGLFGLMVGRIIFMDRFMTHYRLRSPREPRGR